MEELKPYPFCGEKARLFVSDGGVCVKCMGGFSNGCGNQTGWFSDDMYIDGMDGWRKTKATAVEKAVIAWNRRANDGTR